jgi:lipid A oxidase
MTISKLSRSAISGIAKLNAAKDAVAKRACGMIAPVAAGVTALGLVALPQTVQAEIELSFYSGYQTSPHSRVTGTASSGAYSNLIGWQGKSFAMPPYYGMRGTYWRADNLGFALEFSHNKAYAPASEMPTGFTRLEFTDGHNIITANVAKRWPGRGKSTITPYVSAGVGFAMPHVDVTENGNVTLGYQVTGPAARLTAGASYAINDRWSVFGEYQFTWSENDVDLTGGGTLNTRIITNALNIGVGFNF